MKSELHFENGLLLWNDRLVVPEALQSKIAKWVHEPHLGVEKTLGRAKELYFWPGMNLQIKDIVETCNVCEKFPRNNQKEPLRPDELPKYPYHIVGIDMFEWKGEDYVSILDSYSNYLVAIQVRNKTSGHIIEKLKEVFDRIGYPSIIRADNSPFASVEFERFANEANVNFRFSSPRYPQSNGLAEKGVAIAKNILKRCLEGGNRGMFQRMILGYNSSPVASLGFSPCELFFGRKIKSNLPIAESALVRMQIEEKFVEKKIKEKRGKQKEYYDRGSKDLEMLEVGERIMFKKNENMWVYGKVKEQFNGRSYLVVDGLGNVYRRNRRLIKKSRVKDDAVINIETENFGEDFWDSDTNDSMESTLQGASPEESSDGSEVYESAEEVHEETRTRSGRQSRRPNYLNDYIMD
jgi:hypothetical protein